MWFVAGAFAGPAAEGEGALGIWATTTDPTRDPFAGEVFAVDGGASSLSIAPMTHATSYEPEPSGYDPAHMSRPRLLAAPTVERRRPGRSGPSDDTTPPDQRRSCWSDGVPVGWS